MVFDASKNQAHLSFLPSLLALVFVAASSWAEPTPSPSAEASPAPAAASQMEGDGSSARIAAWCTEVREATVKLGWKVEPCGGIPWKVGGTSVQGRPLIYAEFGDSSATNATLVLSMVHGDEITPLYLGLQLANWLKDRESQLGPVRVVLAPLVNPDGFFGDPRTRVNARGVDVNRNLPTEDWAAQALKAWKMKFRENPRRFPGSVSNSEPETTFQLELLKLARPQKVLSVHSPLNMTDYDGPNRLSLARFPREYIKECLKLRTRLKAKSTGYFPGSLGNYAGKERGIPTITLELPSADPKKAETFWQKFSKGIHTMIEYKMPENALSQFLSPRS